VYEKMLGYTEEELRKLSFFDVTHGEHLEPNRALVGELLEGTRQQFQIEKQYRRKNGSVMWVRNNVSMVPETDRVPRFLMALSEDITERKLAEDALSKARSELAHVARITSLGVLTASIAHEVNQPLSGIITNAGTCLRMLAAEPPNVEGARETARRTIRDGNRAAEVITRLRALYGKKDSMIESVDLNEATREVLSLSLSDLQRNRVLVQQELADDLPLVAGNRVQLQQVVLNLLRNASDAMSAVDDRPRQLLIRTEGDGDDHVRLSVRDAGVGFAPQSADRLFESFYTTKNDGMGIGLSVSRSIIESHHGRLWATPNTGPGATFSFSIPRASEAATGANSNLGIRTPDVTDAA
jgi:PAS domain S-box-containing protein